MRFEYQVVPFLGQTKSTFFSSQGPETVAKDLETILNARSAEGWEYVRVEEIEIIASKGCCLLFFLGSQTTVYRFHQIVFRRPISG